MGKATDDQSASRYERWSDREFLNTAYTFADEKTDQEERTINYLERVRKRYSKTHKVPAERETIADWIQRCKELIYDVVDGTPVFHAIAYTFNVSRAAIEIGPLFDILVDGDTPEERSESIRSTLATAYFTEVPVVPNTEELAPELARHHRDLMVDGFMAPDGTGQRVKLRLTKSPGRKIDTIEYLRELRVAEPHHPAELVLLREAVERELERLSTADRVLTSLSFAIDHLESLLTSEQRNENALQRCLTENPILFGLEYRRVIPKHRLGSEFELDYALERVSGLVDLVEIEASSHRLFTKSVDPTNALVHAEQQVLDWLDWLDRHHAYARDGLPGLLRPRGYVVIGRSRGLTAAERRKLDRRNSLFGEPLQVLTYDDVLERGRNMKNLLLGVGRHAPLEGDLGKSVPG